MKSIWILVLALLVNVLSAGEQEVSDTLQTDSVENTKVESKTEDEVIPVSKAPEPTGDTVDVQSILTAICGDKSYLVLKRKSLDKMTEREFHYFMQRDKYCCDSILKDTRTEFVIKEESSKIYKARNIFLIIGSLFTYTLSAITFIQIIRYNN